MYGLLLESLACFIKEKYGEEKWEEIRRAACIEQTSFSTHSVYPENLIPKLSTKAIEVSITISRVDAQIFRTQILMLSHEIVLRRSKLMIVGCRQ